MSEKKKWDGGFCAGADGRLGVVVLVRAELIDDKKAATSREELVGGEKEKGREVSQEGGDLQRGELPPQDHNIHLASGFKQGFGFFNTLKST